ncbi:hypothetical protein ACFVS2_25570 [Brevibacillus sp. NPDC058079]|uniref:hypothetical protein n=1 Tax=Brevibacillus sp. NPDC058079 TaxID=3346330 RepID=UPI0036E5CBCE
MTFKEAGLNKQVVGWIPMPRITSSPLEKEGRFDIELSGSPVGTVDVSRMPHETYVSVTLVDTVLTIEQFTELVTDLKLQFSLPNDQKVSIQQI